MLRSIVRRVPALAFLLLFTAVPSLAAVATITADEIRALQKSDPKGLLILDVRTSGEFSDGRIPGAVNIQMRDVPYSLSRIGKDKKVVAVCAVGARSGAVADYLSKNGYPWVRNYSGGMADWARRSLPIEK